MSKVLYSHLSNRNTGYIHYQEYNRYGLEKSYSVKINNQNVFVHE